MADIELFYNRQNNTYIIKEGEGVLELTEQEFTDMKSDGRSPLLLKLWCAAKKQRQQIEN